MAENEKTDGVNAHHWQVVTALAGLFHSFAAPEELFPRIVDVIVELLQVEICSIMTEEKGTLAIRASRGLRHDVVNATRMPVGDGIAGWVYRERKPLLIDDIETDERFCRHSMEKYYTHSLISAPLVSGNSVLGVLNINNKKDHSIFSAADFAEAQLVADMIAVALQQGLMYDKVRRRVEELEALYGSSKLFTTTLELQEVMQSVLRQIEQLLPLETAVSLVLNEKTGQYEAGTILYPERSTGEYAPFSPEQIPAEIFKVLFNQQEMVVIDDGEPFRHLGWPGLVPAILLPLVAEHKVVGIILCYPRAQRDQHIPRRLLRFLADGAGLAIKNSFLYQDVHQRMVDLFASNRELQQQSEQLDELNRYNTSIIEGLTSGLMVIDPAGRIITCNAAALDILRLSADDMVNRDIGETGLVLPLREFLQHALPRREEVLGKEIIVTFPGDANPLCLGVSLTPFTRGVIVRFRDMTQLKRLQEQVIWSEKLASIGSLAAGVAHELNNPLGSISGYIQLLLQGDVPAEQARGYLQEILEEIKRISGVVKNLLDFSRHSEERYLVIDMHVLLEKTIMLLKPQIEKAGARLEFAGHGEALMIEGNITQLRSLVVNLFLNALQSLRDREGHIAVAVYRTADRAGFTITDNGVGIPERELNKIFEPFYTRGKQSGTGIGLSIARKIVEEHGGGITVTSTEGEGSQFRVELPLAGVHCDGK